MERRNVAIIAHVDHGKTTLVDALLKQSHTFRNADAMGTTIMDSNPLERERGITIFAKNASIVWKDVKINIVDTPGHADFGGEVERIMNIVDGCLLLVDAKEGPMPQTKFVLKKAIEAGHKIIVVINKVDKKDARPEWVLGKTFDLFVDLGASDDQADFPVIYASAVNGIAGETPDMAAMKDISPVLDLIVAKMPSSKGDPNAPLQMSVVNVAYDNYKGKLAIGRIIAGRIAMGQGVMHIARDGKRTPAKVTSLMAFSGLERQEIPAADAGEIVSVAGIADVQIGETIADPIDSQALPIITIEEPTVKMNFSVNTSPFAGKEGQYSTSRNIKERLERELMTDVALRMGPGQSAETFVVSGRGELHLEILIEKMRREGYEFQVSRPQVIFHEDGGKKSEPFEQVFIECPENTAGSVIEKMGKRKGEMKDMKIDSGTAMLEFDVPTRGLIGYRAEFLTDTKGLGIINSLFLGYRPWIPGFESLPHGSLIAFEDGTAMGYGLAAAQERGQMFIGPGVHVYHGMVVGQNAKPEDLEVNVAREKRLSNMRSKGDGAGIRLDTPRDMSLEDALEYLGDDELLEVTPLSLRIRKATLDPIERKRTARIAE
ncbi:MAG: translational GTPase TypA [Patescibacteria group bacterium]